MARTLDWWTERTFGGALDPDGAVDLLAGSGLAVAGATVMRALGNLHFSATDAEAGGAPGMFYGLRVDTTAAASDLSRGNINGFDWLWIQNVRFYRMDTRTTGRMGSDPRSRTSEWDTTARRTLATGETLWLVWTTNGMGATPLHRLFSRALILGPDV